MADVPKVEVQEYILSEIVEQLDPNHENAITSAVAYEFSYVKFYQKKNPYNDSEEMNGSEGGAVGGNGGWLIK